MATPRRLEAYPDWMLAVARRFENGDRRVTLNAGSPAMAKRYRQQLYGFIRAMERDGMLSQYPNFQTVRLVIEGDSLHILHVDEYLPQPKGLLPDENH